MTRALGVLLLCGGVVALVGIGLTHPEHMALAGIYAVGIAALALGGAALVWARHARTWTAHCAFAAGTGLICLGIYFSGAPTGLYAALLLWLVIVAASFWSARAVAAHIVWIQVATGITLAAVGPSAGPPPVARWAVGGLLLAIAATVVGRISAGRRATEERLRAEIQERERLQRELEHLADHDPLTGVANRRRLEQDLTRELARARRDGTPLCVVTLDLDELKEHNDAYGHAAGDRLLKQVASAWSGALRATDLLARTGGDEFVVLLPDCPLEMGERLMDRLRQDVAAMCKCSAGVACWDGRESPAELLIRADLAMYDAKARSRRRGADGLRVDQPPNQRARRLDPNSSFSATRSDDGALKTPVLEGPERKSMSTRPTRPAPNSM
jgi:diguanylate cyclase (GGDEF)-like protein